MQDHHSFIIHRVITQSPLPSTMQERIRFAAECLKKTCEQITKQVTVLQTPGGFLFNCQDLGRFPTGTSSRSSDYDVVVDGIAQLMSNMLTIDLIQMIALKTDFVTFGVDIFQRNDKDICDYNILRQRKQFEKHVELVGTFDTKQQKFISWTGKSHPTSTQQNTLLYCSNLESHFQYFGRTPVLVLGCHDLNIFSHRSRTSSRTGTYKGNLMDWMQKKCDEFKPEVVLHHPHTTDSPQIWSTAWSGIKRFIPTVRTYSSGIHYENLKGGKQRKALEKVIAATKLGNVENTIIENSF